MPRRPSPDDAPVPDPLDELDEDDAPDDLDLQDLIDDLPVEAPEIPMDDADEEGVLPDLPEDERLAEEDPLAELDEDEGLDDIAGMDGESVLLDDAVDWGALTGEADVLPWRLEVRVDELGRPVEAELDPRRAVTRLTTPDPPERDTLTLTLGPHTVTVTADIVAGRPECLLVGRDALAGRIHIRC